MKNITDNEINIAVQVTALSVVVQPIIKKVREEIGEEEFVKLVRREISNRIDSEFTVPLVHMLSNVIIERNQEYKKDLKSMGKIIKNISFFKG